MLCVSVQRALSIVWSDLARIWLPRQFLVHDEGSFVCASCPEILVPDITDVSRVSCFLRLLVLAGRRHEPHGQPGMVPPTPGRKQSVQGARQVHLKA